MSLPYSFNLEMVLGLFTFEIHECKLLFAIAAQRRIRRTADLLFADFFLARDGASAISRPRLIILCSRSESSVQRWVYTGALEPRRSPRMIGRADRENLKGILYLPS